MQSHKTSNEKNQILENHQSLLILKFIRRTFDHIKLHWIISLVAFLRGELNFAFEKSIWQKWYLIWKRISELDLNKPNVYINLNQQQFP
jgi:hypothetical protein